MRFLVDECVGTTVAEYLKSENHTVFSVFDESRGASDEELLAKSYTENFILITSDKDFGEMIFKNQKPHKGIILIRCKPNNFRQKIVVLTKLLLNTLPKYIRKTMTYDNGIEMANHKWLSNNTGMDIYFANPYSSWERGTNENTNGLIRRFFPKGTDFNKITIEQLKQAQFALNNRPRKILGQNAL